MPRKKKAKKKNNNVGCAAIIVFILAIAGLSNSPEDETATTIDSTPRTRTTLSSFHTSTPIPRTPIATTIRTSAPQTIISITHVPTSVPTSVPATSRPSAAINTTTRYVSGTANARSCASTDCEVVTVFSAGDTVTTFETVIGQSVNGSTSWWRVSWGNQNIYIHSSLVSNSAPIISSNNNASSSGNTTVNPVQPQPPAAGATCPSLSALCSEMTCEQAYACLAAGNRGLDRDSDGVPCESVCPGG